MRISCSGELFAVSVGVALLTVLAEPWFVIAWYAVGFACAVWVVADEYSVNTNVPAALKWCWPIIVLFFSAIGLLLYLWTCRPPNIAALQGDEAKKAYRSYAGSTVKKVTGSVSHCVGGDGLGVVSGLASTLASAADALESGRRLDGIIALDGAYRLSDVLRSAADSKSLDDVFALVQSGRTAIGNGELSTAAVVTRTAARVAMSGIGTLKSGHVDPAAYVGAVVLGSTGTVLGNIVAAHGDAIVIESGGLRNVVGFFDLRHGTRWQTSANEAIFGEHRVVGVTMVIVVHPRL